MNSESIEKTISDGRFIKYVIRNESMPPKVAFYFYLSMAAISTGVTAYSMQTVYIPTSTKIVLTSLSAAYSVLFLFGAVRAYKKNKQEQRGN